MIYMALDTNVLLHYKLFTEIDWPTVADSSDVTLLIALTVIHELDARKYIGSDERLKNRAQMVLRQIEAAESMGWATPCIHLALAPRVSVAQLQELQLDPESADDRILGELLAFQSAHDGDIRFVTADYGARVKAKGHGLTCIALAPELASMTPTLASKKFASFANALPGMKLHDQC